jgi:WD40 repeat protein
MLIGSHDDGDIRIWNFYTIKLIKKIKSGNNPLRGICKWNENYIFIGSKDKTIKIVDINNGKIVKSIGGHQSTVLSLKVINLDKSGYCLASQGMGKGEINFWEIQY